MSVVIVVQARMGSSRLPGKVLRPLAGRPMLTLMLERLAHVQAGPLVIATSDRALDTPIAALADELGVRCVRGSEKDVLARVMLASRTHRADHIVRLTADCPLADPRLVDEVVATHHAKGTDYTSNTLLRTYPDGLDVEVVRREALEDADARARDAAEREHVTPFIYRDPGRYRLAAHIGPSDLEDERWTVDTVEDFAFIDDTIASLADAASTISWQSLLAVVGRRYQIDDETVVLHVRRPGATGTHVGPLGEAGHRTWDAFVRGTSIGQVSVRVDRGVGTIASSVPVQWTASADAALQRRLAADLQVLRLEQPRAIDRPEVPMQWASRG